MKKQVVLIVLYFIIKTICFSQESNNNYYEIRLKSIIEYIQKDTFAFKSFNIRYNFNNIFCFSIDNISHFRPFEFKSEGMIVLINETDTIGLSRCEVYNLLQKILDNENERKKNYIPIIFNNYSNLKKCINPEYNISFDFYSPLIAFVDIDPIDFINKPFVSVRYAFIFENNKIKKVYPTMINY